MAGVVVEHRANKLNDRVKRYVNLIESDDPQQIERAINKLEQIDMSLDILSDTGCGRVVNRLIHDEEVGNRAKSLVNKWRLIADTEAGAKKKAIRSDSDSPKSGDEYEKRSIMIRIKAEPTTDDYSRKSKSKSIKSEPNDFDTPVADKPLKRVKRESMNDFEAQLMEADRVPKKKKKHEVTDTRKYVPDADDVQKTLRQGMGSSSPPTNGHPMVVQATSSSAAAPIEEGLVDFSLIKRKGLTKVYAGRRKNNEIAEVPTLTRICQRYFQEHINQIDELGDVPYNLLACVFERCTTEQLDRISSKNPQLHADMDPIWERHVRKLFPNKEAEEGENWYHCYKRQCRDREQRLKSITKKINQRATNSAANDSTMRTQATELINPMRMQKKQLRSGLMPTYSAPDARSLSHARREIFNSGSKSELMRLPGGSAAKGSILATNGRSNGRSSTSTKASQPKKGALMTKTLRMFRNQRR